MKQLLAGSRKFKLNLISHKELMSLTERANKVTSIQWQKTVKPRNAS